MPKGIPNTQYTGEFKQEVMEEIKKNQLSENQVWTKYGLARSVINQWEGLYLEESVEGLYVERRGRGNAASGTRKGRQI